MSKLLEAFFESLETPKQFSRKIWLCRFPVFFAALIILIGPIGISQGATIFGNAFLIGKSSQMAALTAMTLVSATLLMKQMSLVFRHSHERFSDVSEPEIPPRRNWSWLNTVFLAVAGFTLPLTCWIYSMHEVGGNFVDDPEMTFETGMVGIAQGVAMFFLIILVFAATQYVLEIKTENAPLLPTPILESTRLWVSARFLRFKNLFKAAQFELLMDFLLLLLFYFLVYNYTSGSEMTPEDMLTTPFYLVLLLTLLAMILSGMSYFLDYYRISTLVVFVLIFAGSYYFSGIDHRFQVVRIEQNRVEEEPSTEVASGSSTPSPDDEAKAEIESEHEDIVIVLAPGGGIHASAWTGRVLSGLHERYGERFGGRLKLISAVSGGSVGAMFYLDHFQTLQADADDESRLNDSFQRIIRRSSTSSLEALAWGFSFPDTVRMFFGNWVHEDRGAVQERRWLRRMDVEGKGIGPTLYEWKRRADRGMMPYVVFNATEAETGRRVLFSTYQFERRGHLSTIPFEARAIDFLTIANEQFDLPISTAVRLSATFPYASAAAMPAKDTLPLGHVVDGGYVDNEGLSTALDFIRIEEEFRSKSNSKNQVSTPAEATGPSNQGKKRRYVIVRILHTPPVENRLISPTDPGRTGTGWEYASVGPLMAMSNVRVTSQRERGEIELSLLKEALRSKSLENGAGNKSEVVSVVIQFTPSDDYKSPPLNWRLSPKQRLAYQTAWQALTSVADGKLLSLKDKKSQDTPPTDPTAEFSGLDWFEKNWRKKETNQQSEVSAPKLMTTE
jgi:hypothetical protein